LLLEDDHVAATAGIERRKGVAVPRARRNTRRLQADRRVMAAQVGLVEALHTLRQLVCVKG